MLPDEKKAEGEAPPPRRKRKEHHEEHEAHLVHDESNWLVSYADMMTLLFGFFVLMYSFSRVDKEKFEVVRRDLVKYFGGEMKDPGGPTGPQQLKDLKGLDDLKAKITASLAAMKMQGPETAPGALDGLGPKAGAGQGQTPVGGEVIGQDSIDFNVETKSDTLIFTIGSDVLFPAGSARPSPQAMVVVNKIFESTRDKNIELLEVEGHTDGDAISTVTFPSNWELSTARAASVVRIFENLGVPPDHLKASGYGPSRPAGPEVDDKGAPSRELKAKNRRVVINLKVGANPVDLKKKLAEGGLELKKAPARPMTQDSNVTAGSEEITGLQDKYEAMNKKLQDASRRLQDAQEKQKKLKELEKMAKKTEEMERKLQEMETKTQQTLEQNRKMNEPHVEPTAPATEKR